MMQHKRSWCIKHRLKIKFYDFKGLAHYGVKLNILKAKMPKMIMGESTNQMNLSSSIDNKAFKGNKPPHIALSKTESHK